MTYAQISLRVLGLNQNKWTNIHLKRQFSLKHSSLDYYQKVFQATDVGAKLFFTKHPNLRKAGVEHLQNVVQTIRSLDLPISELPQYPSLMSQLPVTIAYRMKVLSECGFTKITVSSLSNYLSLVKRHSIKDLMESGLIERSTNVRDKLCSYLDNHLILLMKLSQFPYLSCTLDELRHRVLWEYLNILFEINRNEYDKMLSKYVTIRHRPLQVINDVLYLILNDLFISKKKLKNNLFLLYINPENVRLVLNEIQSIGGVETREILKKKLKLLNTSYKNFIEIQEILNKFGVSLLAQQRCFEIYTLSPATVYERLAIMNQTKEFKVLFDNPRFLRLVFYKRKAESRLDSLKKSEKLYPSLDLLTRGDPEKFETYLDTPGEIPGGMDVINTLQQTFGSNYSSRNISINLKKHPLWMNVPLVKVSFVLEKLQKHFELIEIYENIQVLLYPWDKMEPYLNFLMQTKLNEPSTQSTSHFCAGVHNKNNLNALINDVDYSRLTGSHKLNLVLYCLEKDHNFSGNGIWSDVKSNGNESYEIKV